MRGAVQRVLNVQLLFPSIPLFVAVVVSVQVGLFDLDNDRSGPGNCARPTRIDAVIPGERP